MDCAVPEDVVPAATDDDDDDDDDDIGIYCRGEQFGKSRPEFSVTVKLL
jgi:hypothetical protein